MDYNQILFRKRNTSNQSYNFDAPGSSPNLQALLQQQQLNVQLPHEQQQLLPQQQSQQLHPQQQHQLYPQQQYAGYSPQSTSLPTPLNKVNCEREKIEPDFINTRIKNLYFIFRFGLLNSINTYLRLKIHLACGKLFSLKRVPNNEFTIPNLSLIYLS